MNLPDSQSKHVQVNPSVGPPLMLITHRPMSQATIDIVRQSILEADELKLSVIEGFEVFQLIDGRWIHVDGSVELEGAPIPEPKGKINFREFL